MSVDLGVRQPSPFTPGFNQSPTVLVGRDDVLDAGDEALAMAAQDGRTPAPLLIVGSRGVGKTVLLTELAARGGSRYGWPRLHLEISTGTPFTPHLVATASDVAAQFDTVDRRGDRQRRSETVLKAQIAGIGGEMRFAADPRPVPESATALRRALLDVIVQAVEAEAGVVFTLDELQSAEAAELAQLAAVLQEGTGAGWPLVVIGAGLADMRRPERTVSYLERADWYEIGALSASDTIEALRLPAERAGRPFDVDALEYLAAQTGGYPFAVQVYGHQAWRASTGDTRIRLAAAEAGAAVAARRLEGGLYANRWEQTSPKEREYLSVVAVLAVSGDVTGRAVADYLGVTTRQLSYVRDALIKKGTLIVVADRLRFTVPGMADWVRKQTHDQSVAGEDASDPASGPSPPTNTPGGKTDRQRAQALRARQQRNLRPGRDFGR